MPSIRNIRDFDVPGNENDPKLIEPIHWVPEEALILKRNPDAEYSESHNVFFWRTKFPAKFHIVENEDSRGFVRTGTQVTAFKGLPTGKTPLLVVGPTGDTPSTQSPVAVPFWAAM